MTPTFTLILITQIESDADPSLISSRVCVVLTQIFANSLECEVVLLVVHELGQITPYRQVTSKKGEKETGNCVVENLDGLHMT